ncbi:MAG: cysteine-rich CWC family protein [Chitinophagaceae bacterium]|nr:cysteine-rich CWC family protein [Chitinophagaceae bacterium]
MIKHEEKYCERCGFIFECRMGDICKCQCYTAHLSEETQEYLQKAYGDCLCRNCMIEIEQAVVSGTLRYPAPAKPNKKDDK